MKLKIQGNSLRLRLTRSEVEKLRAKSEILEAVTCSSGGAFVYRLQTRAGGDVVQADLAYGMISVSISSARAERWATSQEAAIYGHDGELKISVEKDFRCSTPAPEADSCPHPAGQYSA